jgi:hypothetical protein
MNKARELWESPYRQRAQEVITALLAARTDTGWVWCHENTFMMRALQAWSDSKLRSDDIIRKVLSRMKESCLGTVEDFEVMHAEIRAEWARQSNDQKTQWEFFVPLVMKLADDMPRPTTVSLLGRTFVLNTWKTVESTLGVENIDRIFVKHSLKVAKRPETCLLLTADGVNSDQAWDSMVGAFDLFRGLLEFVHGFSCRSASIVGEPSARSLFPLCQWLLARSAMQGLEASRFMSDPPLRANVQTLEPKGFDELVKNAAMFSNAPVKGSTAALLADSLRLYVQALDEPFRHTCLLGLWQMAETLTLSNRSGGDTKMVCTRLVTTVGKRMRPSPTGLQEILQDIAEKRNRMVHHGIHDTIDDEDINILKVICEMALWCVMRDADKLPTQEHLDHFLMLSNRPKGDLEVMDQALEWVHELEKKLSSTKGPEPEEKSP